MPYEVVIRSAAQTDVLDSAIWYEQQRDGWGHVFSTAILGTLQKVARNPETYPLVTERVRRASVDRFPFGVFYVVEDDRERVVVIAVIHASRDPDTWTTRLRE